MKFENRLGIIMCMMITNLITKLWITGAESKKLAASEHCKNETK